MEAWRVGHCHIAALRVLNERTVDRGEWGWTENTLDLCTKDATEDENEAAYIEILAQKPLTNI